MRTEKAKFKTLAVAAAAAAYSKKAEDIKVYDLSRNSSVVYFTLILSAGSPAHMNAVSEEIKKTMKKKGFRVVYKEGETSRLWQVLDFGGLMVHVFEPETRMFYDLDRMYRGVPKVSWRPSRKRKPDDTAAGRKVKK